jgi:predicted dehydrogenase/nucleoside-diphosphate-sugar epimerase
VSGSIRVGLIGAGKMGMHHLRAIARVPNAAVVGVADPAVTRDTFEGALPRDAALVADADRLLNELRPDVVHIVTPPETHAALAMRALRAGCHVYVEKPFTPSRAEAAAVLDVAADRGLLICAGHQCLFERPAIAARETLPLLGRLVHAESYFSFRQVRRTITPADQARDILPHAVYPLVEQLRIGSGIPDAAIAVTAVEARADGDLYALLRLGDCTGILVVTLRGRPIEQYQHLVGTNGWMRADYITGAVTTLPGPGTGPGVLLVPYRRACQALSGATKGFSRLLTSKSAYPGLDLLISRFYSSIASGGVSPVAPRSILDTVEICERVSAVLEGSERTAELAARERLIDAEQHLRPSSKGSKVIVTGGTGLLGRRVAEELRHAGMSVRVLSRRIPRWSARLPGVDYDAVDLARGVDPTLLAGATAIVHCAAETAGGKDDHERNSIGATRNILESAARAGVSRFIHVSSLAVLKPGSSAAHPLDEQSPVDAGNLERGPYAWGKAESEVLVRQRGPELGCNVKIVRLGPLVEYSAFHPPGRLGREIGPWFVAIGGKRTPLSVCDVGTAARVLRSYVQDFETAPSVLNLVEAPAPTRRELAERVKADRPDLRFLWVPATLLRILSPALKLVQRVVLHSPKPIDVYGAFASEHYRTDLAAMMIAKAGETTVRPTPKQPAHA